MNKSKATGIGITEEKLDETNFDAEIYIEGWIIVWCDRDRKSGGVVCHMQHDICCTTKSILSKNIEVTFVDFLLQKTKPISVVIAYRLPKDINFLQLFAEMFNSLNQLKRRYLYSVTRI